MVKHGVRRLVDNVGGRIDFEAGPFLHGGTVDGFLLMLLYRILLSVYYLDRK